MRLIILGDVVGRPGRQAVQRELPGLRERYRPDLVVVNGENAAGGFGITARLFHELRDAGADVVTLGNHAWDQGEILEFIQNEPNLIRPINYPPGTPGAGAIVITTASGKRIQVINAMGRVFMDALDDPFRAVDRQLEAQSLGRDCDAIIVDFHAEATSEKQAMGHFLDGRVSVVFGTHTHVPTCDHQVLEGGTAYVSDAGMCGDFAGILGMDRQEPMQRFLTKISGGRLSAADGEGTVCGLAVDVDDATGLARRIGLIRLGGRLEPALPDFW